jgi:hypothetical protein
MCSPSTFVKSLASLKPRSIDSSVKMMNVSALYTALFNNQLKAQTEPSEYEHASRLVAQYYECVQLCRKHDLASALARLRATDAEIADLAPIAFDFVMLFHLSAWGNYYYKANDEDLAINTLLRGLSISASLERNGYQVFIYRRIEQLQNIATIYLKQQRHDIANALIKNTLIFVHSGVASNLFIHDWDSTMFSSIRILQESTLDEGLCRLAKQNAQFMTHPIYNNEYYYQTFFRDLLLSMQTDTYNRNILYNWMYVKAAYFEEGPDAFFRYSLEFFKDPGVAKDYDELKANLLSQAVWHVQQIAHPQAQVLTGCLIAYSRNNLADRSGKALEITS